MKDLHKSSHGGGLGVRRSKQVRFCTGVSANLVRVICPIYLLFSTTKFDYSVFLAQLPTKMGYFPPKKAFTFFAILPTFLQNAPQFGGSRT